MDPNRSDFIGTLPHYEGPVRFTAAVLRGDHAGAQHHWDGLAAIADPAERMREVYRLKFALRGREAYFLHAAQAWARAEPQSVAARLLVGLAMNGLALQARGNGFAREVEPAQMARFRARFAKARAELEPIAKRADVYAWAAHAALALPYFFIGESEQGWASIEYLIGQAPQYGWLYIWAMEYTMPRWAGEGGAARRRGLAELAAQHRLNAADAKVLDQEMAHAAADMDNNPNPQAWRPYWQKRQNEAPHLYNLLKWLSYEYSLRNWPADTSAQQAAQHWMREAARQGHTYAQKKAVPQAQPGSSLRCTVAQGDFAALAWAVLRQIVLRY